jgi:hypothetical protein
VLVLILPGAHKQPGYGCHGALSLGLASIPNIIKKLRAYTTNRTLLKLKRNTIISGSDSLHPHTGKLPWQVVIDLNSFDGDSGFIIIANSTLGEMARYNGKFNISSLCSYIEQCCRLLHRAWIFSFLNLGIECVTLTEPGAVTALCASRVRYDRVPFCVLVKDSQQIPVPCKTLSHDHSCKNYCW